MKKKELDEISDDLLFFVTLFFKHLMKAGKGIPKVICSHNKMLYVLSKAGPTSISEIGRRLSISKPNMTTLVDRLIKEGLVERTASKKDRRIINVHITEKGKKEAGKWVASARKTISGNLSGLKEKDIREIHDSVERISKIISRLEGI